jgi:Ca2+-binding RTX toxin-like protein
MVTVIRGTPGDDTLRGTARADRIEGLGGNDTLAGLRGDDLLLGGAGEDRFLWSAGDGRDRFEGGAGRDFLILTAARGTSLRLHLDALGAGPDTPASGGLQVVGVKGVEAVEILGTGGADRLVVSSDAGAVAPDDVYGRVYVTAGAGRNQVDAGGVRAETSISTGYADTADAVVRGSAKFHDTIETADGALSGIPCTGGRLTVSRPWPW